MENIITINQFEKILSENALVLVYFSGNNCNVCKSLKPKIELLTAQQFPSVKLIEVPTEEAPELAAKFNVFTIPVVLFFADGREYIREARMISTHELSQKIDKIVKLYEE